MLSGDFPKKINPLIQKLRILPSTYIPLISFDYILLYDCYSYMM